MVNRSRQNNGYAWQNESKRSGLYVPKDLIPTLKQVAYNLDAEGVTSDSEVKISISESEITIKIIKK